MQKYYYEALTPEGKTVKGSMLANSDEEIKQLITKNGNYCVSFEKINVAGRGAKPLSLKHLCNFCSQLGAILKAGLPLVTALEMLYSKVEKSALKTSIGQIYEMVQKGNSLSDSLAKQGRAYPAIMLNMVKAGEMSGDLDNTLNKLSDHFEKANKTKNTIKTAMRYPKMLFFVTLAVVALMIGVVLPKMVESMDKETLPPLTKGLLGLSDFIVKYWMFVIVFVLALYIVIPIIKGNSKIRYKLDKLKLTMPKVGKLMRMVYTARFARSLATLYDGGIQLIDAMSMCTAIVGNDYVAEQMEDAIYRIKKGETISKAMASIQVFDPLLTSMIFVGEESGVLGEVLLRVADYFDEESDVATKGLTSMIEPIMLIFMAGVILVIILAIVTPMYSQYDNLA